MNFKALVITLLLICKALAANSPPSLKASYPLPYSNEKIESLPLQAPQKTEKKQNYKKAALIGITLVTLILGLIFTGQDTGKRATDVHE